MSARRMLSNHGVKRAKSESGIVNFQNDLRSQDIPSDTRTALDYFQSAFARVKFNFKVPAIVLKHQLYSLVTNRTLVDQELGNMQDSNEIVMLRLHTLANEIGIVFTKDLLAHLRSILDESIISSTPIDTFLSEVIPSIRDVALDRHDLEKYHLDDSCITKLMDHGLLVARDHKTWWLSLPNIALFTKSLAKGRSTLLRMIKLCKFQEILLSELEKRDLSRHSKLGIMYHIHDLVGAELVNRIESTSGTILRIEDDKRKRKASRRN